MIAWACGWQSFTILSAGTYTFTVLGAGGGEGSFIGSGYFGGKGASVTASVFLEDGDEIFLVIGRTGASINAPDYAATTGGCRAT